MVGQKFAYYKRTVEDVEARLAPKSGKIKEHIINPDVQRFMSEVGRNTIRILPATWDRPRHYGYDIYVHYNIGSTDWKSQFLCLDQMKGLPCPICEEVKASGSADMKKELGYKKYIAVWVIDRKKGEEVKGSKLFLMPPGIDTTLVLQSKTETGDTIFCDDPNDGRDINIMRAGDGITTSYAGSSMAFNPSPLSTNPKQAQEWLKFIADNPIPSVLVYKDYDYIKNIFYGGLNSTPEAEVELIPVEETTMGRPELTPIILQSKEKVEKVEEIEEDVPIYQKVAEEEPKDMEEVPITYEYLCGLDMEELGNIALSCGVKEKYIAIFKKDDLITEICENIGIKPEEKSVELSPEAKRKQAIEATKAKLKK